jgi:hypothetical protein
MAQSHFTRLSASQRLTRASLGPNAAIALAIDNGITARKLQH